MIGGVGPEVLRLEAGKGGEKVEVEDALAVTEGRDLFVDRVKPIVFEVVEEREDDHQEGPTIIHNGLVQLGQTSEALLGALSLEALEVGTDCRRVEPPGFNGMKNEVDEC